VTGFGSEGLAIVGLRLESTPIKGIADVLGLSRNEVISQISVLLESLDGDSIHDDAWSRTRWLPWPGGAPTEVGR